MTTEVAMNVDNLLLDPAWYAKNDYHPTFKTLRCEDPVRWTDDQRYGHPYWAITSYDAIRETYERWDLFSNRMGTPRPPRGGRRFRPEERAAMSLDVRVGSIDPPLHTVYRRPMNKHFSVPSMSKMRDEIDRTIEDLISEVADKNEFNLIKDVAMQLPVRVIFGLLGVPKEDWARLQASAGRYVTSADPEFTIDNDPAKTALQGATEIDAYCRELAQLRRDNPGDDLTSAICKMKIDGDDITIYEISSWIGAIIIAGVETTRNALGTGTWQFLENPEQRSILLENEDIAFKATEEVLRWGTPARTMLRVANEDMDFRGKEMRAGDWLILFLASGNRDETVWENADRFDITREPKEHLAWGHGIHKCLGRNLARLELARFFPRFLSAFPDLALAGEPEWTADANSNGMFSMPVTHNGVVRR